jgi:NADH dehydrogenase/NADH:ubiquinone oxidoreductase subunit G
MVLFTWPIVVIDLQLKKSISVCATRQDVEAMKPVTQSQTVRSIMKNVEETIADIFRFSKGTFAMLEPSGAWTHST